MAQKIQVSDLVHSRLERLAIGGKFRSGSSWLLADGRWEVELTDDVYDDLQKVHADPERAMRILLGLPGGRDN